MPKAALSLIIFSFLTSLAFASGSCPITLLSGTGDATSIAITFQNAGKLPIRQLEFNCVPVQRQAHRAQHNTCREANALFFPGMEYTVRYSYPRGLPEQIQVSLKSVTLSNGYVWKPSQRQSCRVLRIKPEKDK
jgi:hypothetical protein